MFGKVVFLLKISVRIAVDGRGCLTFRWQWYIIRIRLSA